MSSTNPDVIVIGGGPSGSAVSALLAMQGHKVELFEREHFPRFHIGESSFRTPITSSRNWACWRR